ncbi:MAG TPA: DUF1579 family protein [Terriglobales bacterium]|nr:DUF1579 family protein [Terriglobales bacterium]
MKTLSFALLAVALTALSQTKPEPLDGPNRPFHDDLLDNLQGKWKVTGTTMGKPREMELTSEWVLNHQFLLVHEKDAATVEGKPPYDAHIYIGYDNTSERYVLHWLDVFGGRVDETLGYGTRAGNSIKFIFEYPDGPFHNTFTWNPETKTWRFLLEQKNAAGKWTVFADHIAARAK